MPNFIDTARITVRSGNGGNGAVAFHREKYVAAGGPDGGDGGCGGDVILKTDRHLSTLMDFRYKRKYVAENGQDGQGRRCTGKDGADLIIKVPVGTVVKDGETGEIICDMSGDEPFVLDIVGQGQPWFCKYICPSGTLFAGIPLVASNPALQSALGWLFNWKVAILVILLLLSVAVYRPFCRYLCPLGAIYGLFNPVALYRFRIDAQKCTQCGACQKACPMDIPVHTTPNSMECIRCGKCKAVCPHGAICSMLQRVHTAKKEST